MLGFKDFKIVWIPSGYKAAQIYLSNKSDLLCAYDEDSYSFVKLFYSYIKHLEGLSY